MPFGFWVLGNRKQGNRDAALLSLKCLSAFGFWGTSRLLVYLENNSGLKCLSAFGFWGTQFEFISVISSIHSLKCLSAFGFWGTEKPRRWCNMLTLSLKCLSAFGFWGTVVSRSAQFLSDESQMPFGFWVLGNLKSRWNGSTLPNLMSQMPFGFWVLGNTQRHETIPIS